MKPIQISRASWILIAIGTADLCTTILWIRQGAAQEANPLFHYCWNQGLLTFIVAKYVFLLGPIMVMEWARRYKPRFVMWALRAAVLAYVGLYGLGVVRLNGTRAQAEPHHEDPFPNVTTEVIHGHNGKTHIIVHGLPDEFYTQPSPRQRRQALYSRELQPAMQPPAATSPGTLTYLPRPARSFRFRPDRVLW